MIIKTKPLSVNKCWQGRRFKTKYYKEYEKILLWMLPNINIPKGCLSLEIIVGFSNKNSDIDNIAKPFIDILQKRYKFNDKNIYKLCITKTIVKRGGDFIDFEIYEI